ncbi:unnamed protein product [Vitrella brassicaformis CCMP3155]|uniref:Uncharacterized protein n=1 Tax=Vitrella brassicaformis (strain CCMP3155) TaxID=1169540 RepID=A0A0G4GSN3_VITBC|nr:unnamed protein product [Vitrella brassicaformis CCMP3155]|eukprot:CEM33696.1 unnamed protein product [Vitrella brassicaformis CCMP3155]
MKPLLCLVGALLVAGAADDVKHPSSLRKLQESTEGDDDPEVRALQPGHHDHHHPPPSIKPGQHDRHHHPPSIKPKPGHHDHHHPPPRINFHSHEDDCDCWCGGGLPGKDTHGSQRTYNCPCECRHHWRMGCDCKCGHHHHEGPYTLYHPCDCTCY